MSDLPNPDQPDDGPDSDDEGSIRDFRRAKDEATQAKADAEQARRELAFAKAGIDTDSGIGKLAFQSYDGEPTREAVLEFAKEYGIATASTEAPVEIGADERSQTRERAALHVGAEAPPAGAPDVDPRGLAWERFAEARREGLPTDTAAADYFGTLFGAANAGDKRAVYDAGEWKAANRGSARGG